ncbi:MAG: gamma-glutamyl-gamma-aminobutyrate hydrolase family protein [Candidatus Kapaibacterium sp.]|nr:MAG: gamma-glutamyl-gamma-aminobutyrate hydrolase family protein [Candidatus Kapabacteria bacterium]
MKIGLSKASGSPNYAKYDEWLKTADPHVETIDLSLLRSDEAANVLETCIGLVLTGGPDVHPSRYGKESDLERCSTDNERDELEFALYAKAKELKMPVLGVCRGAQLINVAEGGTLVIDIPDDTKTAQEHARIQNVDAEHPVSVLAGSIITKITGDNEGLVNSAHHQAVEKAGENLYISAVSGDGINEAIEWRDSSGKPFLLGVQWHPERMNYANPYSINIARHFLFEAESYQMLVKKA